MTQPNINEILNDIQFRDWAFVVDELGNGNYIQVQFKTQCSVTSATEEQRGRKWYISPHSTESEIVQTAFLAIITALEHEAREEFKYKGCPVLGPHFDLDKLRSFASDPDSISRGWPLNFNGRPAIHNDRSYVIVW